MEGIQRNANSVELGSGITGDLVSLYVSYLFLLPFLTSFEIKNAYIYMCMYMYPFSVYLKLSQHC